MRFSEDLRAALAQALVQAGPQAPTLCEGWDAHDMVAHLWVRENDPLALPGIGIAALAPLTDKRMAKAKAKYSFAELVRRFANPPIWTNAMSPANRVEFFVHLQDVARPNSLPTRPLTQAERDALWGAVKMMSFRLRRLGVGIVLERSDTGATHRVAPGSSTVTIVGTPEELAMHLTGRAAEIEMVGLDEDVARVRSRGLAL